MVVGVGLVRDSYVNALGPDEYYFHFALLWRAPSVIRVRMQFSLLTPFFCEAGSQSHTHGCVPPHCEQSSSAVPAIRTRGGDMAPVRR
jgi:hypothetical protein